MKNLKTIKSSKKEDFNFSLLVDEYLNEEQLKNFNSSINNVPLSSFILNKNVISRDELIKKYDFLIEDKVDDFIYQFDSKYRLSKSLDNFLGSFYLMDKSSSIISYYVQKYIPSNSLVLDMCSAPGGKSISFSLRRKDLLLISNDISYTRELETIKNAERLGLTNMMMMSLDPLKIKDEKIYDFIILDVPCSGSGMLRKEEKMKKDFSLDKVERLLPVQKSLLDKSSHLLKEGGYLLYSTCSLSTKEDELQVESFLKENEDFEEIDLNIVDENIITGLNKHGYHLVPGIYEGEGIYFTLLKRKGDSTSSHKEIKYFKDELDYHLIKNNNNIYAVSKLYEEVSNYNFISLGIKMNNTEEFKKCDFNHAFSKIDRNHRHIEIGKEEALRYVSGQEISIQDDSNNEIIILTYNKIALGYGKIQNRKIKNYLPKGLKENLLF